MAISGIIEFYASSGAPAASYAIDSFIVGSGYDYNYNRFGFFEAGGPGTFVTIGTYQNSTYIVNQNGEAVPSSWNAQSGELTNLKYINDGTVNPNGSGVVDVNTITEQDATFLVHFTHPTGAATTMTNASLRCVAINSQSGVDSVSALVTGLNIYGFEVGQDASWTKLSNDAATNQLTLVDKSSSTVHDYHIGLSVSPINTSINVSFGFVLELEYTL